MDYNDNLDDNGIIRLYEWLDTIQFSRPKKSISRDFSDGVLMAELIKTIYPKIVEINNYPAANATIHKRKNWITLNEKVFKKIGLNISNSEIDSIVTCQQAAIENVLKKVYDKIQKMKSNNYKENEKSEFQNMEKAAEYNAKYLFYQQQIGERDNVIEQMKSILDDKEAKLICIDNENKKLNLQFLEYTEKIRRYGLFN